MTQQTSLAAQLNKLKIQQKDQIALPQRTRVSFLFDIKQAANIDDQTLFYICQSGLKDLQSQNQQLFDMVSSFQSDILHEKSLEYYRGTMTKDQIKTIHDKLETLIKLMAPYFLNTATHKILEYLVRIYEVHAYHKETLVFSFVPYFETSFFIRLMQLLNLKEDEHFYFMDQYAYKGQSLDKQTLVKAMARNNATLFTKYSAFCFQMAEIHSQFGQDLNSAEQSLHWKFYGTIMVEIFRLPNSSQKDQTLLFNLLPFLSKGLKSDIKDLQISSFLGISQIVCRRSLTQEYAQAFFQQIIIGLKKTETSEDVIQKGILVLALLSQYQNINSISSKDINSLIKVNRISKVITRLSENHDVSKLLMLIVSSSLYQKDVDLNTVFKTIIKDNLNLKLAFILVEICLLTSIKSPEAQDRCLLFLSLIKQTNDSDYNQSILYILKRSHSQEEKDQIMNILQGKDKSENLVSKFGDKEYSLLSALGSQHKVTKLNALQAINKKDFTKKLSQNEKDLIKMSLSHLISLSQDEESTIVLAIDGLTLLIDINVSNNYEFDILEQFLVANYKQHKYSEQLIKKVASLIGSLKVNGEERENTKIQILVNFDELIPKNMPQTLKLIFAGIDQNKKISIQDFSKNLFKQENLKIAQDLTFRIIKQNKLYLNKQVIIELIKQYLNHSNEISEFSINILNLLKQHKGEIVEQTLANIVERLQKLNQSVSRQLISKIVGLALRLKQTTQSYDISALTSTIFTVFMKKSLKNFSEFFFQLALESNSEQKKVFSIMTITHIFKQKLIQPSLLVTSIMILLNDDSQLVREYTFNMISTLLELKNIEDNEDYIEVFTEVKKPQSAKRADKKDDKMPFTPVKTKQIKQTLKDFNRMKEEIINDKSQLQTCLNMTNSKVFEQVARTFLDLPTITIKKKFLSVIKMINKFSFVFTMGLQEQLDKQYHMLKQQSALVDEDYNLLQEIGSVIQKICRGSDADSFESHASTLIFPYMSFLLQLQEKSIQMPFSLEDQLSFLLTTTVLRVDSMIHLKTDNMTSFLRLYLKSQTHIYSKLTRQQIKEALLNSTSDEHTLSDKEIQPLFNTIIDKISKTQNNKNTLLELEVLLETIVQLNIQNEQNLLNSIIQIIKMITEMDNKEDNFFIIESTTQVAIKIISDSKKNLKRDIESNLKQLSEAIQKQQLVLSNQIQNVLLQGGDSKSDPFKDFIMQVDKEEPSEKEEESSTHKQFTGIFQVLSSLFTLMSRYELHHSLSLPMSLSFLSDLHTQLSTLYHNSQNSATATSLSLQLFRFYHNQVIKIGGVVQFKKVEMRQVIGEYIDTLITMKDRFRDRDEIQKLIAQVQEAFGQQYNSLISFVLFLKAKDQVTIKDNLSLESLEISLIQKLLLSSGGLQSLQQIEDILFLTNLLKHSEQSEQFTKTRLNLFFDKDLVNKRSEESFWAYLRYIKDSDKDSRRLKYIIAYIVNDWFSKNADFLSQISKVTHPKSKDHKQAYQTFYHIYLLSFIFGESISNSLQTKDYKGDKKAKKSLKRLGFRVQELQKSLNNLISYDVQISIIMKILEFTEKQAITLKTLSIQLLVNKTPSFAQGMSKVQQNELSVSFTPLIKKALSILEEALSEQKLNFKGDSDKQNFIIALVSLITRTVSSSFDEDIQTRVLNFVLSYLKEQDKFSLILHSQLVITGMTVFEVRQLEILEHLPNYFDLITQSFSKLEISLESKDFFIDSFIKSLLKATLSMCTFFSKFLTATQYEQVIKNILVLPQDYSSDIDSCLAVISQESVKNVGLKLVFQAMINSYESVIIQQGIQLNKYTPQLLQIIIVRFFNQLFKETIKRMKKQFCAENYKKIFQFFKSGFSLTLNYQRSSEGHVDLPNFEEVELSIVQSFEQFVIKLNEEQLRPIIVKLIKWAFKPHKQESEAYPYNTHKTIMLYKALNQILNGLKEFFVPIVNLYIDKTVELITLFSSQADKQDKKRKRLELDFDPDNLNNGHSIYSLMILVCDNIRLNFLYDNSAFIQNDTFEKLSEPISHLVTLSSQLGIHYMPFIESTLKPTVFDMMDRINNDDMWKKMNYELLMMTRNTNPLVRLGTLKIIENLFMKVGERYLVLLNDTIPFLSESMEDENQEVEATARSIVQRIEQVTGDSIQEYLR